MMILLVLLVPSIAYAVNNIVLSDQGSDVKTKATGSLLETGNLTVEIWTDMQGGSLLYAENFTDAIQNGSWAVMLGEGTALYLNYSSTYYKDYKINNEDVNYTNNSGDAVGRLAMQSPLGNVSTEEVVKDSGTNWLNQILTVILDNIYDLITDVNNTVDNTTVSRTYDKLFNTTAEIWAVADNDTFQYADDLSGDMDNATLIRDYNTSWISDNVGSSMDNATLIRDYNTSWITANQGYNTTAEIWTIADNGTFQYAGDLSGNIDNGSIIREYNTSWISDNIGGSMDNATLIRDYNTSWITANQGYNTSAEIWAIADNGTFQYAGDLSGNIDNGSIIREYNTSWITANQGYNTSAEIWAVINNGSWVNRSGDIMTGDLSVLNNISIGTTTPTQKLHVEGSANITKTLYASNISSNSPLRLQTNGTTRIFVNDSTGNVGIGTEITPEALTVEGRAQLGGTTAPSNPVAGTLYFDSSDNTLRFYDGANWGVVQITTVDAIIVTSVTNSSPTNSSVVITWTTDTSANESITYGNTTSLNEAAGTNTSSSFVTSHTMSLNNLTNGTAYYYNITVCNSYKYCNTTGPYNFSTKQYNEVTISGVSSLNIANVSATVNWTTDLSSNSSIIYGTTTAMSDGSNSSDSLVTAHSLNITGLTDNTLYY